jgi:hypothetical protein
VSATERLSAHPRLAALIGALLVVPFVFVNAVVGNRIEPLFSLLRPGVHTNPFEYVVLATVLVLLPLGAVVALLPLRRAAPGRRRFLPLNLALAVLLVGAFALITYELGGEIYRCDVLGLPNCD